MISSSCPVTSRLKAIYALFLRDIPHFKDPAEYSRPVGLICYWSLAVEEQFYLIWPFVIRALKAAKHLKTVCVAIFLGSLLFRSLAWSSNAGDSLAFFLVSRVGELAVGGYLAICYRDLSWKRIVLASPYFTVFSFILFIAACFPSRSADLTSRGCVTVGIAAASVLYAGMLVLSLQAGWINRLMTTRALRWVGRISYGVYVYQLLFDGFYVWVAMHLLPSGNSFQTTATQIVCTWASSIIFAWASYKFFESPILRLRHHFSTS
jgi:peptidoglycan/LPS O-acetylase OafA/YrhL